MARSFRPPDTAEHDGGFAFYRNKPANPDCTLGWSQPVNKGMTVDQNMIIFADVFRKLPIMSIR